MKSSSGSKYAAAASTFRKVPPVVIIPLEKPGARDEVSQHPPTSPEMVWTDGRT